MISAAFVVDWTEEYKAEILKKINISFFWQWHQKIPFKSVCEVKQNGSICHTEHVRSDISDDVAKANEHELLSLGELLSYKDPGQVLRFIFVRVYQC